MGLQNELQPDVLRVEIMKSNNHDSVMIAITKLMIIHQKEMKFNEQIRVMRIMNKYAKIAVRPQDKAVIIEVANLREVLPSEARQVIHRRRKEQVHRQALHPRAVEAEKAEAVITVAAILEGQDVNIFEWSR